MEQKLINSYQQSDVEDENENNVTNGEVASNTNEGSFGKICCKVTSVAFPMAATFTFSLEVFMMMIMNSYMYKNDKDQIASLTPISTMMTSVLGIGMSLLFGIGNDANRKIGMLKKYEADGKKQDAERLKTYIAGYNLNGVIIAGAISIPLTLSMYYSKALLTTVFGQSEVVSDLAEDFLRLYSVCVPALMSKVVFEQIMFSFERTTPAMVFAIVNFVVGALTSVGLGLGLANLPNLGKKGIAAGFILEAYLTSACYGLYLAFEKSLRSYKFYNFCRKIPAFLYQLKELIKMGLPIAFNVAVEFLFPLILGIIAGKIGDTEQAALSSAMQNVMLALVPIVAFGQTCNQEIGRAIGEEKYQHAAQISKKGLLTALAWMIPFPLVCAIKPDLFMFGNVADAAAIKSLLKYIMPIISGGVIMDTARYNILQQLRAYGDFTWSTAISMVSLCAGMGLAAGLGIATGLGLIGVAIGYAAGHALALTALTLQWFNYIKPDNIQKRAEARKKEFVAVTTAQDGFFYQKLSGTSSAVSDASSANDSYACAV